MHHDDQEPGPHITPSEGWGLKIPKNLVISSPQNWISLVLEAASQIVKIGNAPQGQTKIYSEPLHLLRSCFPLKQLLHGASLIQGLQAANSIWQQEAQQQTTDEKPKSKRFFPKLLNDSFLQEYRCNAHPEAFTEQSSQFTSICYI